MGDYPYPSSYLLNGKGVLPAFPVRKACESLDFPPGSVSRGWGKRARVTCGDFDRGWLGACR
jgi:hypothetical protein